MRLLINLNDGQIQKIAANKSICREKNEIVVWVSFMPKIRITLSHPGALYVGAEMTATLMTNDDIFFECNCNENPLKLQDYQTLQCLWPSGAWHLLATINAVEEWLAIETENAYAPMLQKMIFRLIDEASSKK